MRLPILRIDELKLFTATDSVAAVRRRQAGIALVIAESLLASACATPAPTPVVVKKPVVTQPPRPQISADALKVLTQIDDIQETLRQLRNAVDLQQYEQQNSNRRQRQLYDDLDRRLRVLEGGAQPQSRRAPVPPSVTGSVATAATSANPSLPLAPANQSTRGTAAAVPARGATESPQLGQEEATATAAPATAGPVIKPLEPVPDLSPEDEARAQAAYDHAFELLRKSRYKDAIVALHKVVQDYPGSSITDDAQFWLAESYRVILDFEQALLGFNTVIARYPNSAKAPEALLKVGYIQYEMGAYDRARLTLQDVLTRFPESRVAIAAKARLEKMQREGR